MLEFGRATADTFAVFRANRPAMWGLVLVSLFVLVSVLAPWLAPHNPLRGSGPALTSPRSAYPLGTDDLGRDVLSQVLHGTRTSLIVGITSAVIAILIGTIVGAFAGFFGGWLDDLLMRLTEVFQVIPRIFLAILLVAFFGQTLTVTTIAIGVLGWPPVARILRAEFLSKREADYVTAARAFGAGPAELIFREILPNALAPVIVTFSLTVGGSILLEAGLAFIGMSDPNKISLGRMLQEALPLLLDAWWMSVFPGSILALVVLGFNLAGDGLSDVFNPRLNR